MAAERFPLLGFRGESNRFDDEVVYTCHPTNSTRVVVWQYNPDGQSYGVNIYKHPVQTDGYLTSSADRLHIKQEPILVNDPLEVSLAINHLIQKYLPAEVTENVEQA